MKLLVISHHREQSGMGHAARELLMSLKTVGLDVVARSVKLGLAGSVSKEIEELEKKSSEGCDVCIQFLLPHHMRFDGTFKRCIAYFDYECMNFQASGWPYVLDTFDELWVPCEDSKFQAIKSGIKKEKISIVPHAVDPNKYVGEFKKVIRGDNTFIFYYIFDFNERKNLGSLIRAFHNTFYIDEGASLVLKTSKFGLDVNQARTHVTEYINQIKRDMRIFDRPEQYIQEMIITERLTDEKILDLHYTCDCFVNPSHGEAFSYPTLDALGMGKPVIASNNGGMCDIVPDNCGILVGGNYGAVQGVHDTFGGLYVGLEKWFNIDEDELSQSMRQVFDNRESSYYRTMSDNARKVPQKFSYENIGNKVKKLLEVK